VFALNGQSRFVQAASLRVGDVLEVDLDSLYWQISDLPDSGVLPLSGEATRNAVVMPSGAVPCTGSVPGSGCGTRILTFRARATGTAVVRATRTTCGEALRCVPGPQNFVLTVRVGT
jgi:hypothetical protein